MYQDESYIENSNNAVITVYLSNALRTVPATVPALGIVQDMSHACPCEHVVEKCMRALARTLRARAPHRTRSGVGVGGGAPPQNRWPPRGAAWGMRRSQLNGR